MASSIDLEKKFQIAVKTIQNLPANGTFQPSNLTKLIFYGLYKQATLGPCNEPRPSVFNYVARAKWDAWDRYRSLTKEQAMLEYIDEIQKVIKTIPQSKELIEFSQLMGFSKHPNGTDLSTNQTKLTEDNRYQQTSIDKDENVLSSKNKRTNSTLSSISSSEVEEFYDDPNDIISSNENETNSQTVNLSKFQHLNNENGTNLSFKTQENPVSSNNNSNKSTQDVILSALIKLDQDLNNILLRLNQLETSGKTSKSSELHSSSNWLPLSGFRRRTILFILLWPFISFILIRLIRRNRIFIR